MDIDKIKSRQIRVNRVKEFIDFYNDFSEFSNTSFSVHSGYEEEFKEKKEIHQHDYKNYVINNVENLENFETNLKLVLQRINERTILLEESCQYIIRCLTALIQSKQGNRIITVEKITISSVLSVLKEIERTILSINVEGGEFCTHLFLQTQIIKRNFLIDTFIRLLDLISITREDYQNLSEEEFANILSIHQRNPKEITIAGYKLSKKCKIEPYKWLEEIIAYSRHYLLEEEREILNNTEDFEE